MTPHVFEWNLKFFGTAMWSFSQEVTPIHPPVGGQIITVSNPTDGADATTCVEAL